jgi:DNA-binding response OmpR family regulator
VSKQILLVDDDQSMLMLMSIAMKRNGYTVIEAESGDKALALLNNTLPDLIILDVMMPGMNGIELCAKIRARPQTRRTPVLMLSAATDRTSIKSALEAGANAYLPKLTPHQDLIQRIRGFLDGPTGGNMVAHTQ